MSPRVIRRETSNLPHRPPPQNLPWLLREHCMRPDRSTTNLKAPHSILEVDVSYGMVLPVRARFSKLEPQGQWMSEIGTLHVLHARYQGLFMFRLLFVLHPSYIRLAACVLCLSYFVSRMLRFTGVSSVGYIALYFTL